MSNNVTCDVLDILSQTKEEFFSLTKEELIEKFEHENNKIKLVNQVKDFIFENGLSININNIFTFIEYYISIYDKIDKYLMNELIELLENILPNCFPTSIRKSVMLNDLLCHDFKLYYFIKKLEISDVKNKYAILDILPFQTKPNQFKLLLSLIILNRLENVNILFKQENRFIDFSKIDPKYNNFYIYDKLTVCENESQDNYRDLKIFKSKNESIILTDKSVINGDNKTKTEQAEHDYYNSDIRQALESKVILKNKIISIKFWLPYKNKEIGDFKIDFDKSLELFGELDFKTKFNLIERINDYKETYETVKLMKSENIKEATYKYIFQKDKIIRYFFDTLDETNRRDYNIIYNKLQNIINDSDFSKSKNIFCNFEYSKFKEQVQSVLNDENNTVFFVFDLKKAFYSIDLNRLSSEVKKLIINSPKTYIYFRILFRFILSIAQSIDKNYLPITSYSQLIFKIYFLAIFNNMKNNNFLTFVDDFIVYGSNDEIFKTFNKIKFILKDNNLSISSFKIYDKLFNNSITILKKEYEFSEEERKKVYENYKKKVNNETEELVVSLRFGIKNKSNNNIRKIVFESEKDLLNMLNDIVQNKEKFKLM
jgi:hypothetical protein